MIGETLVRATADKDPTPAELTAAMAKAGSGRSYLELAGDPLACWIESEFGLTAEPESGRLVRKRPTKVADAAERLHQATGRPAEECREAIEKVLQEGAQAVHPETRRPLFAFRLHQFLSKGDTTYVSLEPEDRRYITSQYQVSVPGRAGQDPPPARVLPGVRPGVRGRHTRQGRPVRRPARSPTPRAATRSTATCTSAARIPGPPTPRSRWAGCRIPGWSRPRTAGFRCDPRCRSPAQGGVAQPGGDEVPPGEGLRAWYIPSPFRFCLRCRVSYEQSRGKDFAKLATFASEGRSSAVSIISTSILRSLREERDHGRLGKEACKLLTFVDNRQDASLQAGHLNDFVQVAQVRAALYRAAKAAGEDGLRHDELAQRVAKAMNPPLTAIAQNPEVKFGQRDAVLRAFRGVLAYLIYLDLERGWRITMPNLEQTGLLRFDYVALDEIAADTEHWARTHPALRDADPELREELARIVLDEMRRALAVDVDVLTPRGTSGSTSRARSISPRRGRCRRAAGTPLGRSSYGREGQARAATGSTSTGAPCSATICAVTTRSRTSGGGSPSRRPTG